ncbi:MAG: Deoxyribose-phosphate aldolase [candidate division BRC1 bacterium ADurb.BinA364]|nr:MAG: Deoxyribose-phosphate aldolase [candidate division BRC1 bacterium ADurb.BinA364]
MSLPTVSQLAAMIDHAFLKAFGEPGDIERLCDEARAFGFAMVAVNPAEVERCVRLLEGCRVGIGAAIGFPLGQTTPRVKLFETLDAIQRGATEIDMVINVRALQAGQTGHVRDEIAGVAAACRSHGVTSKAIIEACYLTDDQKRTACLLAREAGADFVKTSTGFGAGGATVEDVRLIRQTVGEDMGVKAAGGVFSLDSALAMIKAGASRIGTSAGVAIVDELKRRIAAAL